MRPRLGGTHLRSPAADYGRNEDGSVSKLSKRHGATGFEDLVREGYLPEAVTNYIALLGWCPKENREMFTLKELEEAFRIDGISKSPAVFDYDKLSWFNAEYLRAKTPEEFTTLALPYYKEVFGARDVPLDVLCAILQPRVTKLNQIPGVLAFLKELPEYDVSLFVNKKSKTTLENSAEMLGHVIPALETLPAWTSDAIHETLLSLAERLGVKNGTVMWPRASPRRAQRSRRAEPSRFSPSSAARKPSEDYTSARTSSHPPTAPVKKENSIYGRREQSPPFR